MFRRRIGCILFCTLIFFAACSSHALEISLETMSDQQLWDLKELLDAELELRGLSTLSINKSTPGTSVKKVWIPQSGSRYHAKSTCSGMKDPVLVEITFAKELGLAPCKRCNPGT